MEEKYFRKILKLLVNTLYISFPKRRGITIDIASSTKGFAGTSVGLPVRPKVLLAAALFFLRRSMHVQLLHRCTGARRELRADVLQLDFFAFSTSNAAPQSPVVGTLTLSTEQVMKLVRCLEVASPRLPWHIVSR